jgi:hypothetical protein
MLRTVILLQNEPDAIQKNSYRLAWAEFVELYGEEGILRFIRGVLFENVPTAPALCSEACDVAPGVSCIHGCPSLLDALPTRKLNNVVMFRSRTGSGADS